MARTKHDPCTCGHERQHHEHWTGRCLKCIEQVHCSMFNPASIAEPEVGTIMNKVMAYPSQFDELPNHSFAGVETTLGLIIFEKTGRGWVRMRRNFDTWTVDQILRLGKTYLLWDASKAQG